jgi:hypothetical protein
MPFLAVAIAVVAAIIIVVTLSAVAALFMSGAYTVKKGYRFSRPQAGRH